MNYLELAAKYEPSETLETWQNQFQKQAHDTFNALPKLSAKQSDWKYLDLNLSVNIPVQKVTLSNDIKPELDWLPRNALKKAVLENVTKQIIYGNESTSVWPKKWANEKNPFVISNLAVTESPKQLVLTQDTDIPLLIPFLNNAPEEKGQLQVTHPQLWIRVCQGVKAHIVIVNQSGWPSHLVNALLHAEIEQNARLDIIVLYDEHNKGLLLDQYRFNLAEKSHLNATFITTDGTITRSDIEVTITGENAHASLNGLTQLHKASESHIHTKINHKAPNSTSEQNFKTILHDDAKAEYHGAVVVDQVAQKTNASQSSYNLILSDKARAIARPQLEIFADDVKCGHGSTTGQLNDQALYYLQSRGLNANQAKSLMINAIKSEIIGTIAHPILRLSFENKLLETL